MSAPLKITGSPDVDRGARFIVLLPVFTPAVCGAGNGELKFTAAR